MNLKKVCNVIASEINSANYCRGDSGTVVAFQWQRRTLVVELRATPVPALLVPLDAVSCAKPNPIRDRAVLVQLFGILLFDGEWLEAAHFTTCLLLRGFKFKHRESSPSNLHPISTVIGTLRYIKPTVS